MSPSSRPTGPRQSVRLADAGEHRRDQLRQRGHPGGGGRVNREMPGRAARRRSVNLQCWPQATTSDIPLQEFQRRARTRGFVGGGEDIVVTGSRVGRANLESASPVTVLSASQENLGDLKLYRIPEPVTVAANSQKQVALLTRPDVRIALVYRQGIYRQALSSGQGAQPPQGDLVRPRTSRGGGLGLPLPAGSMALFGERAGRPLLLGEGTVWDHARRHTRDRAGRRARSHQPDPPFLARIGAGAAIALPPQTKAGRPSPPRRASTKVPRLCDSERRSGGAGAGPYGRSQSPPTAA